MMVKPVSHEADIDFMADPGHFQPTLNTDSVVVKTNYTPLFGEAAEARNKEVYVWCFYDVYEFETMTVLGHCNAPVNAAVDLCEVMPGLSEQFEEGKTYAVFATVIEQYEGACRYEPRTVCCNLFNATSHRPITITKQPDTVRYVAGRKGGQVTLTAEAANATDAYWEMTAPYYRKLKPTTFQNGKATLTVPVEYEATYRCQFTNPYYYSAVHDTYTYIPTNEAEVAYMPAFELGYDQTNDQFAVQGYDTEIVLWHNGQEDRGQPFYGWDYGQAGMYAWYKDGEKLTMDGTHYEAVAYWGGGLGLRIKNVTKTDAGMYECRCGLEDMPFGSGKVDLDVLESAGWVYDVSLTGMKDRYVGDLPPEASTIRTNDIRVGVTDVEWANLDAGGHITAESYYTITVEAKYGATFDETMTWNMDGSYMDVALVSADGKEALLVDTHKYEGRGDYVEEDDTVVLNQTSFTVYQGLYSPLNGQFRVSRFICPSAHSSVLGHTHEIGSVELAKGSLPYGLKFLHDGFCGQVFADPGVYKATLRYAIVDADTGEKHNSCDVEITFNVMPAQGDPSEPIEHIHDFCDWTSDGPNTHSAVCIDCGESMWFPHDWDEGTATKIPTRSTDGIMTYTCSICGETRTEALPYEDYMPPFPEVGEVSYEDGTLQISLTEYSGDAADVRLCIAAYDQSGKLLRVIITTPDKTGKFETELGLGAKRISVFVLDKTTFTPLTDLFSKTVG
ncbi:MAG: immunoglobulin domain-containing protein [Clostridia bacterium]|nr:immunoglobulin domain-containing protein [Clostridia bacterium]